MEINSFEPENVPKSEIGKFTKEYSPWARENLAKEIRELRNTTLVNPENETKIKELRDNFYKRFQDQKIDFEESLSERDVRSIAEREGVIFVHTIPTSGIHRRNTSDNNEKVDLDNLDPSDIIEKIIQENPDLSCSSVSFTKKIFDVEKEKSGTMYPFGLVMGSGTILSTYRFDAGTITEKGRAHKKSKYDPEVSDTSIQPNISEKISNVIDRKFDRYKNPETGFYDGFLNRDTGKIETKEIELNEDYRGSSTPGYYDEFVISNPRIDGLYIDLDKLMKMENYKAKEGIYDLLHQYKNVPIYVKEDGEVLVYTYDDDGILRSVTDVDLFTKLRKMTEAM